MTDTEARRLPRRLWREGTRPTAEEFATWSRGVFLDQLVPMLERIFEAACPIDHLPSLRKPRLPELGEPCDLCGPGYRIGDDGCRHGAAAAGPPPPERPAPLPSPVVRSDS